MNRWLLVGGLLSAAAALLHLALIAGGPDWRTFFGADSGTPTLWTVGRVSQAPAAVTAVVSVLLAVSWAYAFSGAGVIGRLPLLRTALVLISLAYVARALTIVPTLLLRPEILDAFAFWTSIVMLLYGVTYSVGTYRGWRSLGRWRGT